MKRRGLAIRLLLLTLMVAAPRPVWAASPATAPAELGMLLTQLADEQWQVRQAAQDRLVDLGDAAEPRLRELSAQTSDPEMRTTVDAILARIQAEKTTGTSLVTLHIEEVPVRGALAMIADQTGEEFHGLGEQNPMFGLAVLQPTELVTIDMDRQPFWTVVREVCRQTKLWPVPAGAGRDLTLVPGMDQEASAPAVVSDPFMIVAVGATWTQAVAYGQVPQVTANRQLNIKVLAEPKLVVFSARWSQGGVRITDEVGRELTAFEGEAFFYSMPQEESVWEMSLPLPAEIGDSKTLKRVSGQIEVCIMGKSERIEIPDILKAGRVETPIAGQTFVIEQCTADESQITLKATIHGQVHGMEGMTAPPPSGPDLVDAFGRRASPVDARTVQQEETTDCEFIYSLADLQGERLSAPFKLVWEIPTEIRQIDVPFEFTDLPLP
jgi:hypothetical protein